jgi:hypothetical protein
MTTRNEQERFKEYMKTHHLEAIFNDLTAELIKEKPEEPIPFLIEKLKRNCNYILC